MPTYRVYLRRPTTAPPIWDFSETVVATNADIALGRAYETWRRESTPPALSECGRQVLELHRTSALALGAVADGQQAFSDELEKKVAEFVGTKLDGTFSAVAVPAGFNYGITYGSNAYYNKATLQDVDTLLSVSSSGQLELAGGRFSTLYHDILGAVTFSFSTADQDTMNDQDSAASAQIASILSEFENAGGTYSDPLPSPGGKLQDVINQLTKTYGGVDQLPDTLNSLRNAIASYKATAAESSALHDRWYEAKDRLEAAQNNVKTPTQANGGQQVAADEFYVGYTPNKLPTANQLLSGLETEGNAVSVQMTLSNFSSTSTDLSVSGGVGFSIPIADIVTFDFDGSASYDLSTYTSSTSNVTIDLTYKGVTLFASAPTALSTDGATGWYADDILAEVVAKTGKDATGFKLQGSEYDVSELFGPGKVMSRLKTFVISQPPEMVMTFTGSETSKVASDMQVNAKASVDLFGLFKLGSASASYTVQKVETHSVEGGVVVTFGAPEPSGTTPIEEQVAYVMGGVASYPPNDH